MIITTNKHVILSGRRTLDKHRWWETRMPQDRRKDRKSNLHHNATRKRYYYRQGRKLKPYFRDMILEGVTWNIDLRDMFEE